MNSDFWLPDVQLIYFAWFNIIIAVMRISFALACYINTDRSEVYRAMALVSMAYALFFLLGAAGLLVSGSILTSPIIHNAIILRNLLLIVAIIADFYVWYVIFKK